MKLGLILTFLLLQTTLQTYRSVQTEPLAFQVTSPATIVAVTPDTVAVSSGPNIYLLSQNKAEPDQTFTSTRPDPQLQAMRSLGQAVFNNDATLFQLRSQQGDLSLSQPASANDVPVPSAFRQNILIVPSYEAKPEALWVNAVTGEKKTISYSAPTGNIVASSGVTLSPSQKFYLASGGQCDGATGKLNLYEGDANELKLAHQFDVQECLFGKNNREWKLTSKWEGTTEHHLLSYAQNETLPRLYSTQLYTKSPDTDRVRLQILTERLLGANVLSENEVYSADGVLCRATLHNVQNYPTVRQTLQSKPLSMTYSRDQTTIVSIPLNTGAELGSFELYSVDAAGKLTLDKIVPHPQGNNFIRAQFINQTHLIILDNRASLYVYSLNDSSFLDTAGSLDKIVDFAVSAADILFAIQEQVDSELLWAFELTESELSVINSTEVYGFKQVFILDDDTVFLAPNGDGIFMIWELLDGEFNNLRDLIKQNDLESEVNIVGGLIIFTSIAHDKPFVYDSQFEEVNVKFNLAPGKNYKIVHSSTSHLFIAVGDDLTNLVALDCYKFDGTTLVYAGSYPITSGGAVVNIGGIVFLPEHDLLYVQYVSATDAWVTPYKVSNPPQVAYGHFINDEFQDCADHKNAIFFKRGTDVNLLITDIIDFYPVLLIYRIEGTQLTLTSTSFLDKFKGSDLKIKLSADDETLDIYGINSKTLKYSCESRSILTIDAIIYETEYDGSIKDRPLEDSVISNGKVASLFADKLKNELSIEIKAISKAEVPIRSVFDKITAFATCVECNLIAFTGSINAVASNSVFIADAEAISDALEIDMTCPALLVALSQRANFLAWVCQDFSVHAYDLSASKVIFDNTDYTDIRSITFLDDIHLVLNAGGNIQNLQITAPASPKLTKTIKATPQATVTVDWLQKSYAVNYGDGKIEIFTFGGIKLETIVLKNSPQIASLAYNAKGELLALSETSSTIITLGDVPCPQYEQIVLGYCQCFSTFVGPSGSCGCGQDHVLSGNQCNCNEGYFYVSPTVCTECSFMCNTCAEDGFLACDSFGAWFYVFIVILALLLVGIVVIVVLKVKKGKAKADSQFSEGESKKKSEKLLSEDPDADQK